MDLDKAHKAILQWDRAAADAMARHDFHMGHVRGRKDPDLIKAHLAAAQRFYDDAQRFRAISDDCFAAYYVDNFLL